MRTGRCGHAVTTPARDSVAFGGYTRPVTEEVSFFARIWMAFVCWFRVLLDGRFAAQVRTLLTGAARSETEPVAQPDPQERIAAALQLLGLMQREGRLVDFLQQDLTGFSDADVGSAARVVHEGCRRALQSRANITPCRTESEGAQVTLAPGFDAQLVKLTGNLAGEPPYTGVLRHGGWKVQAFELPELVGDANPEIIQPAEVEL